MLTMNIKTARSSFSRLIQRIQSGESAMITRHGKNAAMLVPVEKKISKLPSLRQFRNEITASGPSLSSTIVAERSEERY
jgi:prevent-host-death family protein